MHVSRGEKIKDFSRNRESVFEDKEVEYALNIQGISTG